MKNTKLFGIIASVAIIIFSMTGCPDGNDNGKGKTHVHDWEWTVNRVATCIATGEEAGVCKLDPSHTTTREIPIDLVDGHDWGDWTGTVTCTEGGTGTRTCKLNQTHTETNPNLPPLGHNYEWTQTTDPTCTEAGVDTGTCTRDPTHKDTRTVAALGHDYQWKETTPAKITETQDTTTGLMLYTYIAGEAEEICSRDSSHIGETRATYFIDRPYITGNTSDNGLGSVTVSTPQIENITTRVSVVVGTVITITATPTVNANGHSNLVGDIKVSTKENNVLNASWVAADLPGTGNTRTYTMPDKHIQFSVGFGEWRPTISGTVNVTVNGAAPPYGIRVTPIWADTDQQTNYYTTPVGNTWSFQYLLTDVGKTIKFMVFALDSTGETIDGMAYFQPTVTATLTGDDMPGINLGTFNYDVFIPFVRVIFNPNGGMAPMVDPTVPGYRPINVNVGDLIPVPVQPTKPGATFGGWWNEDFTVQWNFQTDRIPNDPDAPDDLKNITLYAKWN